MNTATEQLVAYIRERGTVRSNELDEKFMLKRPGGAEVLLRPRVEDGELVACNVMRPGAPAVVEYRLSVSFGADTTEFRGDANPAGRARGLAAMHAARRPAQPKAAARATGTSVNLPELSGHLASAGSTGAAERAEVRKERLIADQADVSRPAAAATLQEKPMQHNGAHSIGEIEVDVPIPTDKQGPLREAIRAMKPGESRLLKGYTKNNIQNAAFREKVPHMVRKEGDGFRLWRLEQWLRPREGKRS